MGTGKFDESTGKFNLTINIDYAQRPPVTPITAAQLQNWNRTFQKASELLFDATNGKHQLGVIQVCNSLNNLGNQVADLNLFVDTTGSADAGGGFGVLGPILTLGKHMTIYEDIIERPMVIVHELGHFIYGLYDENHARDGGPGGVCLGHDNTGAPRSTACIMEATRDDGGRFDPTTNTMQFPFAGHSPDHISKFCSSANHTSTNEQDRRNGKSCWDTMVIPYPDLNPNPASTGADQIDWVVLDNTQEFVLVIDRSGSMMGEKLTEARFGADWWADAIPVDDYLGIISFTDTPSLVYGINQITINTDRSIPHNAISGIVPGRTTAIIDALRLALNTIVNFSTSSGQPSPVRTIVLLTDGIDNSSHEPLGTLQSGLLHDLINANIVVNTIGIGADVNQSFLQNIAASTGGEFYVAFP
jgi:hypothetical protein